MPEKKEIKVLIVDDSALIRAVLKEILESEPRINVVAVAKDAYDARELIKQHNPDVLTLDIEMPKMNGITFLKNLMRLRPMPVVMISTLTQEGAPSTLHALELGAVDFLPKPSSGALEEYSEQIVEKVLSAARANVRPLGDKPYTTSDNHARIQKHSLIVSKKKLRPGFICAIGASTGGTEAIKAVISSLPQNSPPVVVVQHIPETFSTSFATRVNSCSEVTVHEAEDRQPLEAGNVYIAPGHSHLRVVPNGTSYMCRLDKSEHVNRHRPSVEVLFDSVREALGNKCMGVLLTGMGSDGSEALLRLKQNGCLTIAQDEDTSVVWGMPGTAVRLGGAEKVLPLEKITAAILSECFQ